LLYRTFSKEQCLQIVDALKTRKILKKLKMNMEGTEDPKTKNKIIPQILEKLGTIQSLEELKLKIFQYHSYYSLCSPFGWAGVLSSNIRELSIFTQYISFYSIS